MAKKKVGRWVFLGAGVVVVSAMIAGNINLYRVLNKTRQLQAQVRQLNGAIDSLTVEIEKLKSDTTYIERLAREQLGMARKDEKVYKFLEEDK